LRWLLIGGLLAIAVGTLGLTGTTVATSLGGHGSMMARATMGNDPGRMMGQMMAGAASRYLSEERARSLADQVPEGASADRVAERLTFRTASVRLEVLGSPQGGPEMSFRIAGLINPTISVPRGATIELEFINGDPDTSHGWELVRGKGSFSYMPMMSSQPAFPGSLGMPLGIPSARGWPAESLSFTATEAGAYTYICPVAGHAARGMQGQFLVTAT
jgi:rusticyanin